MYRVSSQEENLQSCNVIVQDLSKEINSTQITLEDEQFTEESVIISNADLIVIAGTDSCSEKQQCPHLYLNKWEGEYLCMDCKYNLSSDQDAARIQIEQEAEAKTPCDTISADISVGKMSQMRGVSIGFLQEFTIKHN